MTETQKSVSSELTAVEAALTERVDTLEERADSHEGQLEARRKSNEGFRREATATISTIHSLLTALQTRLDYIERAETQRGSRMWQVISSMVNLVAGAIIGILSAKLLHK